MFQLLLFIISYGSLLLLMIPATVVGMICAVGLFAIGTGWIIYKKAHKSISSAGKQYFLGLIVLFTAAYLGLSFYNKWLDSYGLQVIATWLQIPMETMLFVGASLLSVLSIPFCYIGIQTIKKKCPAEKQKHGFFSGLFFCFAASVATVILTQILSDVDAFSMGGRNFAWGVWLVLTTILFLYSLFGRSIPSIWTGAGIFMVISTINAFVYRFRGRLLEPVDVFSAGTAMNVMDNYSLFPLPSDVVFGWNIFVGMLILMYCLQHKEKPELTVRKRCALLAVCIAGSIAIWGYASNLKTYHWDAEGAQFNGYVLDFVSKFKEISAPKPDNYSAERIAELAEEYVADDKEGKKDPSEYPHIIVIMDEAFSDLSVIGEFATNMEVTPFISSLQEDTVSGYVLTSVLGGNTANSEYEFLTGNSLAWMSPNVVPYQQYIRSSTYSMLSYLKSNYNYKCVALHPYRASGWNRPAAYGHLGFDECYFLESFPREKYVRKYVSDQEMFEVLIEKFEAGKEEPLFLFGVTMQNHGSYRYTGDHYTKHISLPEHEGEFPETEQYLSVIYETDKAVEYLINYFQNAEEDVVIVFFGDHQPNVEESFYDTIGGATENDLTKQQNRYKVPFFIWANYDIEEDYIDCTSLNYLSSYVYDAAGIALPPYNRFLQQMEKTIPIINANGFYSLAADCYLPLEDANEEEQYWLDRYETLQYNNVFDKKHRDERLFPVLE